MYNERHFVVMNALPTYIEVTSLCKPCSTLGSAVVSKAKHTVNNDAHTKIADTYDL